ncbi:MAG TPA: endonuclease/exonuclease/phosphatase family protein [Polyangiaceae bacterium]
MRFRVRRASARRGIGPQLWPLLLGLAQGPLTACSVVYNYDDPDGPRFDGQYSTTGDRSAESLNLVTFNIQFAARVSTAIDEIEQNPALSEAGVLLLQEMDNAGTDALAEQLGFDYVYYPGSRHQGKDFGNAVLSRWPIVADHKLILPHRNPSNGRIRIAVAASLDTPEGLVHVYSVHTETPWLGPRARLEQSRAIAEDADRFSEPLAIAGDFNTLEGNSVDATAEIFTDRGYSWATQGVTDTVESPVGSFTLDHVFTKGYEVLSAHTQATDASDHQPVWVVLERRTEP